jgi:hypothetical protein
MKKLTSLLCALTIMLGANAMVGQASRMPAANQAASKITLKANQGYMYNMAGTDDDRFEGKKAPNGIMRLNLVMMDDQGGEKINFMAYFRNDAMNSLNGVYRLGIAYDQDDQGNLVDLYDNLIDVAGNGQVSKMTNAYMQASVIGIKEMNGLKDQRIYDIYIVSDQYEFTLQVPVFGINKAQYDADNNTGGFYPADQGFLNDEETIDFSQTYGNDQMTLYTDPDPKVLYLVGSVDKQHEVVLKFNVAEVDANTYIPAGEYTIDRTGAAGTVSASTGYLEGNVVPSNAQTFVVENGQVYPDKTWFFVSGKVVVETDGENLKVTVDAVNEYGKAIKATLGALNTALEDIVVEEGQAAKAMYNGQLIIIRNGVRYNAQGAVVE